MVAFYPFPFYNLALSAGDVLLSSLGGGGGGGGFPQTSGSNDMDIWLFFEPVTLLGLI